jgi:hypothetical protein
LAFVLPTTLPKQGEQPTGPDGRVATESEQRSYSGSFEEPAFRERLMLSISQEKRQAKRSALSALICSAVSALGKKCFSMPHAKAAKVTKEFEKEWPQKGTKKAALRFMVPENARA